MTTLQKFKEEQMKDLAFRKAYEDSEPETNRIRAMMDTGNVQHITKEKPSPLGKVPAPAGG